LFYILYWLLWVLTVITGGFRTGNLPAQFEESEIPGLDLHRANAQCCIKTLAHPGYMTSHRQWAT